MYTRSSRCGRRLLFESCYRGGQVMGGLAVATLVNTAGLSAL